MKQTIQDKNAHHQILFRPQHEFVTNEAGQLMLDYVGKYESLQSEFHHICTLIGVEPTILSRINASQRETYPHYFDSELQEMVYDFYKEDFDTFGYSPELT